MEVVQLQLQIDHLTCQWHRRTILTSDNGYDILSKLSIASLHQIKRIPNRAVVFFAQQYR
jgi:hypothetical protein